MEKENSLTFKKIIFLFVIFLFFIPQSIHSQCTNPDPTGNSFQTFCATEYSMIGDLVADGGQIVWFDAPTGGNQYDTSTPLIDGTIYYADDIANNNCSPNRLAVEVAIYGEVPTNVNVFVGICANDDSTIGGLSATGSNIEWFDARTGGNLLSLSDPLENDTTYWVQQTENGCTSDRLPTTVTIIDPPSATVEEEQSFCFPPNPTVADLQAAETDILWYESETSTIPLDSETLLINGEDYWAVQTSYPCESTIRVKTTVTLEKTPYAGEDTSYTECEVNLETINLFDLLGGTPDIDGSWTGPSELTGGYLGTFDPDVNIEGIYTYKVVSQSGLCPEDSADVTIKIITVPPPTIITTTQSFCLDEYLPDSPTIADLIGGESIAWYSNPLSTEPLPLDHVLENETTYWAAAIDPNTDCQSITRVNTLVYLDTAPYAGEDASLTECKIDLVTTNLYELLGTDADITGTWSGPSELSGGYLGTFDPEVNVEGTYTYTVSSENGACPDDVSEVIVTINEPEFPTDFVTSQVFCTISSPNPTVNDLDTNGENIIWYINETGDEKYTGDEPLEDGKVYWAAIVDSDMGCESKTRLNVTPSIISPQFPTTFETNRSFCANLNPTVADLSTSGDGIIWYETETSTTPLENTTSLIDGGEYWASQTDIATGCESISRLMVSVTFYDEVAPVSTDSSQNFCESNTPIVSDLQPSGSNIRWYNSETETEPLSPTVQLEQKEYWVTQINTTTGCESSTRVSVDVTITDPGTPSLISLGNEFCLIDQPTINDLNANVSPVNGGAIIWYNAYPDGDELSLSELLIDGETYYAIESDTNGCLSINPLSVTVTLDVCDDYDVEIYDGFSPTGNGTNDTFKIKYLRELYPNFKVEFYNRWGKSVYTANSSKPDWNGRLDGDGVLVPSGVYYFIIHFNKDNKKPIQRRLYLSR
ncbi:gliding motility-associated C-terminal domain-containing protein [Lutibacter sp. B1]|uniref:Ig-like domain-containing protein n=1 Tax=Lutibacter sp. B1 TaxID=2725996 RepID=UPI0014572CBD|nr:gliding motility-associated C-terminal domain-containing protein [Lutibacter sp. B1]NLP58795.1 gliding motility-associated C-terminal domain-containing protein [Lutibacter sp. B1]